MAEHVVTHKIDSDVELTQGDVEAVAEAVQKVLHERVSRSAQLTRTVSRNRYTMRISEEMAPLFEAAAVLGVEGLVTRFALSNDNVMTMVAAAAKSIGCGDYSGVVGLAGVVAFTCGGAVMSGKAARWAGEKLSEPLGAASVAMHNAWLDKMVVAPHKRKIVANNAQAFVSAQQGAADAVASVLEADGAPSATFEDGGLHVVVASRKNMTRAVSLAFSESPTYGANSPKGAFTSVRTASYGDIASGTAPTVVSRLPDGGAVAVWYKDANSPAEAIRWDANGQAKRFDFAALEFSSAPSRAPSRAAAFEAFGDAVRRQQAGVKADAAKLDWNQNTHRRHEARDGTVLIYNREGKLDNDRGPAMIRPNGEQRYYVGGAQVADMAAMQAATKQEIEAAPVPVTMAM